MIIFCSTIIDVYVRHYESSQSNTICDSFDGRNAANHLGCLKHDVYSEINFTSMINRRLVGWLPSTGGDVGVNIQNHHRSRCFLQDGLLVINGMTWGPYK